jgi:hypothetical protein
MDKALSKRKAGTNLLATAAALVFTAGCVTYFWNTLFEFWKTSEKLNSLIIGVFVLGLCYVLYALLRLQREFSALEEIRERFSSGEDEAWLDGEALEDLPVSETRERLMLYAFQVGRGSQPNGESHAEKVALVMDQRANVTRYVAGLLIVLGLLGSFIGLLMSLGEIEKVISNLTQLAFDAPEKVIAALISGIKQPINGMATAYTTSVFGMITSLILGFIHLQQVAGQTRFLSRLETLDSAMFQPVFSAMTGGGNTGASLMTTFKGLPEGSVTEGIARYMEATQRQLGENLGRLLQIVERTEGMQSNFREVMVTLAQEIEMTNKAIAGLSTNQDLIREAMGELVDLTRAENDSQRLSLTEVKGLNQTMARITALQQSIQSLSIENHEELVRVLRQEFGALCKIAGGH